jgi:hypothetical protein
VIKEIRVDDPVDNTKAGMPDFQRLVVKDILAFNHSFFWGWEG